MPPPPNPPRGPRAWPFPDGRDAPVLTLSRIVDAWPGEPVRVVARDADGDWQFLDGNPIDQEEATITELGEVIDRDPTLLEVADLPMGWEARRAGPGEPWTRGAMPDLG